MKSLMDPTFVYYHSGDTDLSRTFARVRAEMAAKEVAEKRAVTVGEAVIAGNVFDLPPRAA